MTSRLPLTIKHLLTLRNPQSLPGPGVNNLLQLFTSTFQDAQTKGVLTGWLVLSTCTLLTTNRPSTIGELYRFAIKAGAGEHTKEHGINIAALMRESALKSTIFVGVPRVILSLTALYQTLDEDVRQGLRQNSRRTTTSASVESMVSRGKSLWNSIYTPHADKLRDKLGVYHPDFISFIIQAYGTVLAPLPGVSKTFNDVSGIDDPDQGNLSQALGSVVGIATLRAEGRVGPQLTSHVFGLLKARSLQGQNEEDAWLSSDEGTEWVIRTVDKILDVVSSEAEDVHIQVKL